MLCYLLLQILTWPLAGMCGNLQGLVAAISPASAVSSDQVTAGGDHVEPSQRLHASTLEPASVTSTIY